MDGDDPLSSVVFHPGEAAIQQRLGVREQIEDVGRRVIRDHMPDQHRTFFAQLPFILVGGLDLARQPWATVLAGPAGFVQSPDPQTLIIDATPASTDERRHSEARWGRSADRRVAELRQLSEVHPGAQARVCRDSVSRSADPTRFPA
jgi:predicted pyridoxine 5'-phosphate oxidase superfamily flavin-nucleotide-binding protein